MTSDIIEVQADVIEPVLNLAKAPEPAITFTLPVVTIGNTDDIDRFIANVEEYFKGVEIDVTDDEQVKALKDARADVNKIATAINKKRTDMNKEIKAASRAAEDTLKGMHSRILGVVGGIDVQLKEAEDLFKQSRWNNLTREYEALAPDLMDLIPLQSFVDKESKLMGKTWKGPKACDELGKMIAKAVHERELLRESGIEFAADADRIYCQTLDLAKAHDHNAKLVEERKAREAHAQASSRLDMALNRAREAYATEPVQPDPQPEPIQPEPVQTQPAQPADIRKYRLVFKATKEEAYKVRDFMRTLSNFEGIEFKEITNE